MLDDVLRDGLDQRIVRHGLDEDRAVVVFRGGGHVHLHAQRAAFLQQAVVDVLNGFEPRQFVVVDVVRPVVQNRQFVHVPHDGAQVHFGVGRRPGRPRPQKIVHAVVVVRRRRRIVPGIYAVDVGQEDVARGRGDAHLILHVQPQLKVVPPVAAVEAVVGQHRVGEEDPQPAKILVQPVEYDDVGRNHEKVARQCGVRLIQFVEIAPRQHQAEHLGLAAAGRHFHHEAPPRLVEHARGHGAGAVEAHQVVFVLHARGVVQIHDRFDRLPLREEIAELLALAGGPFQQVRLLEPPPEQTPAGRVGVGVSAVAERFDFAPQFRHERRHEFFSARFAQGLVRGEPAHLGVEDGVGRVGEVGVQRHS